MRKDNALTVGNLQGLRWRGRVDIVDMTGPEMRLRKKAQATLYFMIILPHNGDANLYISAFNTHFLFAFFVCVL